MPVSGSLKAMLQLAGPTARDEEGCYCGTKPTRAGLSTSRSSCHACLLELRSVFRDVRVDSSSSCHFLPRGRVGLVVGTLFISIGIGLRVIGGQAWSGFWGSVQ